MQQKLQKAMDGLPLVLVNEAVNWTKGNFTRQGWPGASFQPWKPRSANAKRNMGRAILVDTGRLKRSIRKISTGNLTASFGTDVPYASAHNNGFKGTVNVKAHQRQQFGKVKYSTGKTGQFATKRGVVGQKKVGSFQRHMNLPRRRFIGNSPVLVSILRKMAVVHVTKILRS